jgi:hypothetical protein
MQIARKWRRVGVERELRIAENFKMQDGDRSRLRDSAASETSAGWTNQHLGFPLPAGSTGGETAMRQSSVEDRLHGLTTKSCLDNCDDGDTHVDM